MDPIKYRRWRQELGLPNPESYDMSQELYTRRYYKLKTYLFGLIKVYKPVEEYITRQDIRDERA